MFACSSLLRRGKTCSGHSKGGVQQWVHMYSLKSVLLHKRASVFEEQPPAIVPIHLPYKLIIIVIDLAVKE